MTDWLNSIVLFPLLTAFLSTVLLTAFSIKIMKKAGLVDDPVLHKHPAIIHTKPIPRGGGIPLYLGTLIAGILFLPHDPTMVAIFFAAFLALTIGVIDDKLNAQSKDVPPYFRFLVNILTAVIVVGSGVSIHFITNPAGGILHFDAMRYTVPLLNYTVYLSDFISVFWLIWVMNMINWSKGVDGEMPGIVAISAIVIGILSLRLNALGSGAFIDAKLSFIIAGSALGFLLFNFYPAKIFPGYGATSLYLLLGVASILTSAKLATAILVLGVPIIDAVFIIIRRILHKQNPLKGDNKHLHHILLKLHFSQRQIALFYWCLTAILGIISLTIQSRSKLFVIVMVTVIIGGGIYFLHAVTKNANETTNS